MSVEGWGAPLRFFLLSRDGPRVFGVLVFSYFWLLLVFSYTLVVAFSPFGVLGLLCLFDLGRLLLMVDVNFADTPGSVWQVYVGGVVAVRLSVDGLVQVKVGDSTVWSTVGAVE